MTDSFHGTVFAILYKKPFFAIPNKIRGAARFTSLLQPLGLEDRMITEVSEISKELIETEIDYKKVHENLDKLKKHSIDFLKNALK